MVGEIRTKPPGCEVFSDLSCGEDVSCCIAFFLTQERFAVIMRKSEI